MPQRAIGIPEPTDDPKALWRTCMALKEAVEILQGTRGNRRAVLASDSGIPNRGAREVISGDWLFSGNLDLPNGPVRSGLYFPTVTNVANLDGSTAFTAQYMQVGEVVVVSSRVNMDPTAAGVLTQMRMSLPVPASFNANENLGGTAIGVVTPVDVAGIQAATATNDAIFTWHPTGTANTGFRFVFMYGL